MVGHLDLLYLFKLDIYSRNLSLSLIIQKIVDSSISKLSYEARLSDIQKALDKQQKEIDNILADVRYRN